MCSGTSSASTVCLLPTAVPTVRARAGSFGRLAVANGQLSRHQNIIFWPAVGPGLSPSGPPAARRPAGACLCTPPPQDQSRLGFEMSLPRVISDMGQKVSLTQQWWLSDVIQSRLILMTIPRSFHIPMNSIIWLYFNGLFIFRAEESGGTVDYWRTVDCGSCSGGSTAGALLSSKYSNKC